MKNTIYTPLNLPKKLVEELKDLKSEWSKDKKKDKNEKSATYETMIRQMIECHKKYGSIDITSQTIADLKSWMDACGIESMNKLIQEMMANNRRYLWWKKGDPGKEIVQRYKAIKLAKKLKKLNMQVSEEDILKKGQQYDKDDKAGFTWVTGAADDRVYDKEWKPNILKKYP